MPSRARPAGRQFAKGPQSFLIALSGYDSFFFRNRRWNGRTRNLPDRGKALGADFEAGPAPGTFGLVDEVNLLFAAIDRFDGHLRRHSMQAWHFSGSM